VVFSIFVCEKKGEKMEFEMQFVEMETGLKVGGSKNTNNKA
jgi:hypothetical protein